MGKSLGKSSTGLDANVAALLCYLCIFISGIIFYLIEKDNKFIRFHAMQSMVVFGGLFSLNLVNSLFFFFLPWPIRSAISLIIGLVSVVLWVVLMIKAYQGEMFRVPFAGDIAEKNC